MPTPGGSPPGFDLVQVGSPRVKRGSPGRSGPGIFKPWDYIFLEILINICLQNLVECPKYTRNVLLLIVFDIAC